MIYIYSENITNRLKYITTLLFEKYTYEKPEFIKSVSDASENSIIINYSDHHIDHAFNIKPAGLLKETGIRNLVPCFVKSYIPMIFTEKSGDIDFDVFSACFFYLSRYEEYISDNFDRHDRFKAKKCLSYCNNYLNVPLVNIWAEDFFSKLSKKFPDLKWEKPEYNFKLSLDIDNAFAYLHKPLWRLMASFIKDIYKRNDVRQRRKVLRRKLPDPYDNYDDILSINENSGFETLIFWLLGNYSGYDKNLNWKNKNYRNLINKMDRFFNTGIHVSYMSAFSEKGTLKEKSRLEKITGKSVKDSRQHYLKIKIPHTYRTLEQAGIENDFSFGFAGKEGFRSGATFSFKPYDLENERVINVNVFPVCVMDASLKYYNNYSPDEAEEIINYYFDVFKKHGGDLIPVWHNESLSDAGIWKGWKKVYTNMLLKAAENENKKTQE